MRRHWLAGVVALALLGGFVWVVTNGEHEPSGSIAASATTLAGEQPPARPCYAPPHYVPYRITARQARYGFGLNGLPSDKGSWMWVSPETKKKWDSGWLPEHPQLGPFNTKATTHHTCALIKTGVQG